MQPGHVLRSRVARLVAAICVAAAPATFITPSATAADRPTTPRFTQPGLFDGDGPTIRSFAVADFDGNGTNDIAVANINGWLDGHGVPVLLGNGKGSFGHPVITPLALGESPLGVAAADFDRDGHQDLAVSTIQSSTYTLRILLGKGDGSFSFGTTLADARGAVASADLDADGNADLAYVSSKDFSGIVKVALGKGDGTFGAPVEYGPSVDLNMPKLEARDVTGDGVLDLIYLQGSPVVRAGRGDGTFGPAIYSYDQGRLLGDAFTVDDFDRDGVPDIALGDATGGHVKIGRGTGDGHFTFANAYGDLAYEVISVASGEFTGDGKLDIVASGDPNFQGIEGELVLLKGKGDGSFGGFTRFVTGGYAMTPAYIDGNKRIDLVSTDLISTGHVFVTLNDGKGLLHAPRIFRSVGRYDTRSLSGDVNGDGRRDVILPFGAAIATHLGDGHGGFGSAKVSSGAQGFSSMALADVSGDGVLDLVLGSSGSKNILVRKGNGDGTFAAAVGFGNGGSGAVLSLAVGDVTGDAKPDVVSYTSAEVSVLPGKGNGSFGQPRLSGEAGGTQVATLLGDVTGDGITDVVAVVQTGDTDFASSLVLVNVGAGDGTVSLAQSVKLPTNAGDGEIGDLTGDGRAEVGVVGTRGSDGGQTGLFVLANTGGVLGNAARYDTGSAEVVFADFNGDGSLDAVATCNSNPCQSQGSGLASFANRGDGTFAGPNAIYTVFGAIGLTPGDFTGDGRPDFVEVIPSNPTEFTLYINTTR